MRYPALILSFLALAVLVGCAADPAADKPDAHVSEAQPAVEPAPGGTALHFLEGSTIGWEGSKVTGSHLGGFNAFDGEVHLVNDDPTQSHVRVTIDVGSIWADNEDLTAHLKTPDFFDAANFPTATFESTSIEAAESGYTITGNLDLHGVTKSISFPAEISVADGTVTVNASFAIKRFDFGIEYKGPADNLIRDEVAINLALTAG